MIHSHLLDEEEFTIEQRELLALYESMPDSSRAALTRLAEFLGACPQSEPKSKEEMKQLFQLAKTLQ